MLMYKHYWSDPTPWVINALLQSRTNAAAVSSKREGLTCNCEEVPTPGKNEQK